MSVKESPSGHRARQAQATREQVAGAARRLFAESGYVATTIAGIAEAAAVPAPTIYSAFGTKAAILAEILRMWTAESGVRQSHQEALATPDPVARLEMAAHWHRRQMELGYDVITIYQEAARVDSAMATEWQRIQGSRERAVAQLITSLDGHLAAPFTVRTATDLYLTLTLAEVYRSLVRDRGWTIHNYEHWLARTLTHQLLGEPTRRPPDET